MITDICNLSFFSLSFCYQKVNPRVFVGVRSGDSIMNQKPSPLHRASEWIVDHYRLFFVVFAALLVFSAVASGWVKVENDVAAYLPADSETRQGLDIMEQEFQTYGSAKILLRDTDADAAAATAEQIRAVDGVDSCTYTMNDTGSALLSVSLSDLEGSDTCAQTVQALRDLLDGSGAYIYSAEGYSISDQINGEVRGLLVIVAIILVTVLTFTSSTYAEVPILLITFLAAALINKGTNFVFGTISFVSNAVAILLQLAMSVDYAIIFCNRYKQAHETLPVREAVIESLEKSITVISSSSLTTIAGLVAMTFMKFGLGRDLGIVLIKAILISMLTVFLLMPGLLLKLGPAMDKTKHRNFVPKISGVGRLAWRTRRVVPLVFAAVLVVIVLVAVLVLVLVSRHDRVPKNDPAAQTTPTAQVTEQDTVLAEAKHLAAQYDYDKAIAAVTGFAGWESVPELQQAKADFEAQKAQAVRYADPTTIPHIFFHTLIADTARAFDGDPEQGGYNQFMATIKEFNAVLQSLYERGFVLVDIHDVAGPQQQADGSTKYVAGDIYLPAGKKPIVLSQDDVCYYEYMTDSDSDGKPDKGGDGFASRLLVKDGKLTCEYVDADGQTLYGSYDLVPLLDDFLDQHPDFSYRGARATIAVTGYQGAFGYRISNDYKEKLGDEAFAQACTDARAVADALRAEGYTIASHSYGHLTYGDISPERLASDAQKWNDQIAAVIGETDVLLYPFGSDIAGVEAYKGAKFDTLYGLGFLYFCNVDSAEHWVQIHDGYVRQGRRNIDGYRMYYQSNLLDDLFDTKTVWDDARPTPVPKI